MPVASARFSHRPRAWRGSASRLTLGAVLFTGVASGVARAEGPPVASVEELAAARALFAEGVRDQDRRSFDSALEKFRRVLEVRDTAQVRFRIGSCLEAVGKLRAAYDAYLAATSLAKPDPESREVARAAREHLDDLERRLPHLTLTLSPHAPDGAQITLDGAALDPHALGQALLLEPGAHTVAGSAAGVPPYRTQISLPEGGHAAIVVGLDPASPNDEAPPVAAAVAPPSPSPSGASRSTAWPGVALLAGGGVLLASAVVSLVVQQGDIDELHGACPGNVCPASRRDGLTRTRDQALVLGPLGVGLGIGGVALAAAGTYLLVKQARAASAWVRPALSPWAGREGGGMLFTGDF